MKNEFWLRVDKSDQMSQLQTMISQVLAEAVLLGAVERRSGATLSAAG